MNRTIDIIYFSKLSREQNEVECNGTWVLAVVWFSQISFFDTCTVSNLLSGLTINHLNSSNRYVTLAVALLG